MKHILILADGMADWPIKELDGKTPMEAAKKPVMDFLASRGEIGLVQTVPEGMSPGSDTANLSVLGYNPKKYYTGRSPLEAVSIGADMASGDVCFRVNFVTVTEDEPYLEKTILDHSADEVSTEEAAELLKVIEEAFGDEMKKFFTGVSYRHALIMSSGSTNVNLTPPHNILGKKVTDYMPKGDNGDFFSDMMIKSYDLLKDHPVNLKRKEKGLRPANSVWPWGEGTKPELDAFEDLFGKKGAMISAVDLLKGIAIAADMKSIDVEGVTGNIHTNYQGKVEAALKVLEDGADFVYIHIEAPDECGHQGDIENKVKAIELIDEKVLKPVVEYFETKGLAFKIALLPDHPTPIELRTHTNEAVPYFIYNSDKVMKTEYAFSEAGARESGRLIEKGHEFMPYFLT